MYLEKQRGDEMRFTKMHGAGNDYVYVDGFHDVLPHSPAEAAKILSDRHHGVGADGLILICPTDQADAEMRMFNADGSLAEMCGNGIRCVAKYLYDHGIARKPQLRVLTGDGIKTLHVQTKDGLVERVTVDMGRPQLAAHQIPTLLPANDEGRVLDVPMDVAGHVIRVTCVSMGNPHCVIFLDDDVAERFPPDELVLKLGPAIENDARFPARVNVEFVSIRSPTEAYQRTWERGSGETLACGTGASAVCVAGVLTGRTQRELTIRLLGGNLDLNWERDSQHVLMTGPAVEVFRGEYQLSLPKA